jgi:putative transposase
MIDDAITELTPVVGVKAACSAVGRPRASHYRRHRQSPVPPRPSTQPRPQPRALSAAEKAEVIDLLHGDRFVNLSPGEVYAILLDEGRYLCSESTMYRLLRQVHGEVRERRRHAVHPPRVKPELVAHGPNECWSWDITKLAGAAKWTYYYLYSIIDIYSRYTVGWMVASCESKELAERLLGDTIKKQRINRDQLTIHADRGSSMASKPVAFLLADLGVTKSHSRPHCSNDNPFSEAQFKTLKYRPDFPDRFGCIEDARAFCAAFYRWYNQAHRHSGIGMHTPFDVHHGHAQQVREARIETLSAAYAATPERFVRNPPQPPNLPGTTWINRPEEADSTTNSFILTTT